MPGPFPFGTIFQHIFQEIMQKTFLIIVVSLVLGAVGYCGYQVHRLSMEQKLVKEDYSIANNISFGLLSINKWRDMMVTAVGGEIQSFSLTAAERDSLDRAVRNVLNSLIDRADSMINAPQHTLGGKLRKFAYHTFVNDRRLHEQVPAFSRQIIAEVLKPRNKQKLASLAQNKLEDLGQQTYDSARSLEETKVDSVYHLYGVMDSDAFDRVTDARLSFIHTQMYQYAYGMLGGLALMLFLWYLLRRKATLYKTLFVLSIVVALVFLLVGLTSTMIEIDARIKSLSFQLLGDTIAFRDQVIFFQSKSILDVVVLLLHTGRVDSILVGSLILCFSIFFPVTKLLSAGVYLLGERGWTKGRFIRYFAFHSGKWSMADVMVVAIFMAYIGFNGILNDQMSKLDLHTDSFTSIATNQTALQPGYIIFVGFVLFGLVLSEILKRIVKVSSAASAG